jgi:hypothetical protein
LIRIFSEFAERLEQLVQSKLPIFNGFAYPILHNPALKIDSLPGRGRQLDPGHILKHPSDFLQVLPSALAGSPGGLQLVEQILEFFW